MEDAHGSSGTVQQPGASGPPTIDVATPAKLIEELNRATAGVTIHLRSGEYEVDQPLLVRDGVTLQGEGVMQPVQGLPVGFMQGTKTAIIGKRDLAGNLLTLSDGSKVEKLVLQGPNKFKEDLLGPIGGNVIAVASRRKDDSVSATIDKCELINNLKSGGGTDGPTGGAILAYTRNPNRDAAPLPHEDANVTVTVTQSIVDTHRDGKAVFAMNFASGATVTVELKNSVVRGPLDVIGGLSRPDAVSNAKTKITSHGNHYSPQPGSYVEAWKIVGGSTPPFPAGPNSNSDSNTAIVESTDDRIEDFQVGIRAIGGRQLLPGGSTCSHNTVNLKLTRMKPAANPAATDFDFVGAQSPEALPAGVNNAVVVEVLVVGTPPDRLFHIDVHDVGFGTGNQLAFEGTLAAITQLSP
jgi:hypothetical protein